MEFLFSFLVKQGCSRRRRQLPQSLMAHQYPVLEAPQPPSSPRTRGTPETFNTVLRFDYVSTEPTYTTTPPNLSFYRCFFRSDPQAIDPDMGFVAHSSRRARPRFPVESVHSRFQIRSAPKIQTPAVCSQGCKLRNPPVFRTRWISAGVRPRSWCFPLRQVPISYIFG